MSTTENIYLEDLGIYFTYDPIGPFYSKEIRNKMDRFYKDLQDGRSIKLKELKKACRSYPHVPQFKNFLANIYQKNEQWDKLEPLLVQIAEEHPDYLFGKINRVEYYLEQGEYDRIPELLEEGLKSLYPDKEVFHETEVSSYYAISYKYFKAIDDQKGAKFCLDILEQVNPDHPLLYKSMLELMQKNIEKLSLERSLMRRVKEDEYDKSIQTTDKPVFKHKEIWDLYKYGYDIPIELLELILLLPRESCIKDLELVLEDSIRRYEFFHDAQHDLSSNQFMFFEHALYLLVELKAKESLDQIFRILDQGEELLEFWYGDALDEVFNEVLYKLDHQNLDTYKAFILSPNKFTYVRTIMSNVVREVYYNYPERRQEVIHWYQEVYNHFLTNPEDQTLIDSNLIGLMTLANTEMNLLEVEPLLKQLWDKGWIPESMIGNWEGISERLNNTGEKYRERIKFFSLKDRYKYIEKKWINPINPFTISGSDPIENYLNAYDEEYPDFRDSIPMTRTTPKVGRNAPCPCGSGKKYKKCCLGK